MKNHFWDVTGTCEELVTKCVQISSTFALYSLLKYHWLYATEHWNLNLFLEEFIQAKDAKSLTNVVIRKDIFS